MNTGPVIPGPRCRETVDTGDPRAARSIQPDPGEESAPRSLRRLILLLPPVGPISFRQGVGGPPQPGASPQCPLPERSIERCSDTFLRELALVAQEAFDRGEV